MHKKLPVTIITLFCVAAVISLHAQYTDTANRLIQPPYSIVPHSTHWKIANSKRAISYKSLIFPGALVTYGVLSKYTDAFQDINETVKEEIYTERQPRLTHIDNYLQYAPAALVYALNIAGVHGAHNFSDRTILYGISNLILGTTVYAVKKITAETRPDGSDNLSFPSGHTATAFAAAEFLRQEYKDVSPWYGIGGYIAASATGYLRISNNKHWVGDVMAGAGTGIVSTKLAYWLYPAIKRKLFKDRDVQTIILPGYQGGVASVSMVHRF